RCESAGMGDCHPERTREGSGPDARGQILREYAQDDNFAWLRGIMGHFLTLRRSRMNLVRLCLIAAVTSFAVPSAHGQTDDAATAPVGVKPEAKARDD